MLKEQDAKKWRNYLLNLWRRHQHKPGVQEIYQGSSLWDSSCSPGFTRTPRPQAPVTFDNWYTQPAFCRFLHHTLQVPYVGTLAADDQVILGTGEKRLDAFDRQLQDEHKEAIKAGKPPVFIKNTIPTKEQKKWERCRAADGADPWGRSASPELYRCLAPRFTGRGVTCLF